jgi:hypothetical protein
LNLGHAIQVINQSDPDPDTILPSAPPTTGQPDEATPTPIDREATAPTPRQPDTVSDEATPLRVSGVTTWITVLVLCLLAAVNY